MKRLHLHRWQRLLALFLSMMIFVIALPIHANSTPQRDLHQLNFYIDRALSKAQARDYRASRAAYEKFQQKWLGVENRVKKISPQSEEDIEKQMSEVKVAFSTNPRNQAKLLAALKQLKATNGKFINGGFKPTQKAKVIVNKDQMAIALLMERLNRADAALNKKNLAIAAREIKLCKKQWLEVEGVVATKSKNTYFAIENNITTAYSFLHSQPIDVAGAKQAIASLRNDLKPFATQPLNYNVFDAAVILIKQGIEALLVLVALLGFLNKSGNGNKSYSIGLGAAAGIVASIITAVVIQLIFSRVSVNPNRQLVEGITSLAAAAMLFYVSYWLHSKSSLMARHSNIKDKIDSALVINSAFAFFILSFLAVYREGAETILFYIGISSSISINDLWTGLGYGVLSLMAIAALILGVGLRIPIKPFFLITSLLIFYLGFKFVGGGIHALQVADLLPVTPGNFLPAIEALGLYSTWETTLSQLGLIAIAIAVILYTRFQKNRVTQEISSEQQTVSENS
ncbi:MAG TPA: FTR1 family protein [Oculatellaceae cyanobacterium]|jgi:high-affinity iron transporter